MARKQAPPKRESAPKPIVRHRYEMMRFALTRLVQGYGEVTQPEAVNILRETIEDVETLAIAHGRLGSELYEARRTVEQVRLELANVKGRLAGLELPVEPGANPFDGRINYPEEPGATD